MPGIFLRDGDTYVELVEEPYGTERILQDLIAQHPQILAGDDAGHGSLVLVKQEAAVDDPELGGSRWSLDHLYLDGAGTPTLVEVKRASDPRSRREVVAQMLEYAANAATSWSVDRLRDWYEETCAAAGRDPETELRERLGVEDPGEFWDRVGTNLSAEHLRLVFVADSIGPELRRMIEYLNRQMQDTEVFAIEVKQYVDGGRAQQTIVPRIIGQTEAAKQAKRHGGRGTWDRESVLEALAAQDQTWIPIAERFYSWAETRPDLGIEYGRGTRDGSFRWGIQDPYLWPFAVYTNGSVELNFQPMSRRRPFDEVDLRDEFRRRIIAIRGVDLGPVDGLKRPSFPLGLLSESGAFDQFVSVLDWAFEQARETADRTG
jgi:hypothetical protein